MKGFTLIEVLITLALFIALLLAATLFNQGIYAKNELTLIKSELKSAVQYARTQSLIMNKTLYLKPLSDRKDWSDGLELFFKNNQNNKIILYKWNWHHPQWSINWNGFRSKKFIQFSSNPFNGSMNGQFKIIHTRYSRQYCLTINRIGRVKESPSSC